MRATRCGMWTAVAVIALAALAGGCGAISQAEQNLSGSLDRYRTTVDNVRDLDLKTATEAEITAARAELAAAFAGLEAQSQEAGRDTADLLRRANDRMDKALKDAAGLPAAARDEAQAALKGAADSLSSAADSVLEDVKSLFQ
jgi:hypothetical protein